MPLQKMVKAYIYPMHRVYECRGNHSVKTGERYELLEYLPYYVDAHNSFTVMESVSYTFEGTFNASFFNIGINAGYSHKIEKALTNIVVNNSDTPKQVRLYLVHSYYDLYKENKHSDGHCTYIKSTGVYPTGLMYTVDQK